ncbi:MAG: DUF4405 domain-containing protein [Lachnospiraceae bacterium]|nr:DUF4405 domain-containing protein [Lachnospiraceae bacterium]
MKIKQTIKGIIDAGMTFLLFTLMAYQYTGQQWHEIAGTAMFVLFILHHALNGMWYRNMGKGNYPAGRVILMVVDALMFVDMLLLMLSGIAMSQYVFRFLELDVGVALARAVHMTASYAGFLFMSFHIGLHYGMVLKMFRKAFSITKESVTRAWILRGLAALLSIYGIYALCKREFMDYIFQRVQFAFFDYNEPKLSFFFDYAAIMALMIFIAYYLQRLLSHKKK